LLRRLITSHVLAGEDDSCSKQKMAVQDKIQQLVDYNLNPFASKMVFKDPFATDVNETLVRPNHSVCLIALDL